MTEFWANVYLWSGPALVAVVVAFVVWRLVAELHGREP